MPEGPGPKRVTPQELLRIREEYWRRLLQGVSLVAEAEINEAHRTQAVMVLGRLYKARKPVWGKDDEQAVDFLTRWPACVVAAMTGVALTGLEKAKYWPAFWEAVRYEGNTDDQRIWGTAFLYALGDLNLPEFEAAYPKFVGPILMHTGIPACCSGGFFRLLADRRHQHPGMDADDFYAWVTEPGRRTHLSGLHKPAEQFLLNGGDYAHDVVDRTFDLLERLADPDPDWDGIRLPGYMIECARKEHAAGNLDLIGTRQSNAGRSGASTIRQAQPHIALDPYGAGVHVVLPAVGDMPDGVARWRITADGKTSVVQSQAMWVGAAEAAPQTAAPVNQPVRTILVSLAGREDLTAELRVVEPSDPVLFFGEDGRRLSAAVSLPKGRIWIMHPASRELTFHPGAALAFESSVPFGWDGWQLRLVSLDKVASVQLDGGKPHAVQSQARPQLLIDEPVPGVATPYGSPVYAALPRLVLPDDVGAGITWDIEVRRAGDGTVLTRQAGVTSGEVDIWTGVPRPALGAFEVTVRGPLGRGLRRTVFIAEGLSAGYRPPTRLLSQLGLVKGEVVLSSAAGATVQPAVLRFGPSERTRPVEYRTETETEPLMLTPPHAALLCPGAGVTAWLTSLLHLVTEDFTEAGRLLIRIPNSGMPYQNDQLELQVYAGGRLAQSIPASGQHSPGLAGFELARAADTVRSEGRAELVLSGLAAPMPVGYVRPRRLASGVELAEGMLVLRDGARIDGLTAGVYPVFAPWRAPALLPVSDQGTAELPGELTNAGPLRVLLQVDDPWSASDWPTWPVTSAYDCPAPGVPVSADDEEEAALSRYVAGDSGLPELTSSLGRLWQMVELAPELVRSGARADLAARCAEGLCARPRAALLALESGVLDSAAATHAMISTGITAVPLDAAPWLPGDQHVLERLWSALPVAAAVASAMLMRQDIIADAAAASCGDSLFAILDGYGDPHARVGRFGPAEETMARWSPEQIEAMWQAAAVVPQALLDTDTRTAAALRMFAARNEAPMRASAVTAKDTARVAERLLAESPYPDLASAVAARQPTGNGGWLALPAMSIAMALTARLAARGHSRCAELERAYRGKWANLALYAPDLVAIDLVLAETLIVAALPD